MKAVTIDQFGGVEKMHWSDLPIPQPLDNEVQIKIAYTSVNPVDWKICNGSLQKIFPYEFPIIPGWDASGIISALGKKVKNFKLGDEVYCYCRKPIVRWGTYAEYVCFETQGVALKPKNLNFAESAAVPLAALTAWQALFDTAKLKKGQTILIHAGSGGVGSFAIQFAKTIGAKIYTTASSAHHSYVKELGADVAIDYNTEKFVSRILKEEPEGLDCILDGVGYETLNESFGVVKPGGHLISIVNNVDKQKAQEKNIQGSFVLVRPDGLQLEQIAKLFEGNKIKKPHILKLPLGEYAKAIALSQDGHTMGKIVLQVAHGDV